MSLNNRVRPVYRNFPMSNRLLYQGNINVNEISWLDVYIPYYYNIRVSYSQAHTAERNLQEHQIQPPASAGCPQLQHSQLMTI